MTLHRNIKLLAWFNFFIDFIFYAPVAILYFAKVAGSYTLGMSVFSVVEISSAAFEIPTGVFSDMIGRKNTVVAGALSCLFAVVCYAVGGTYWMLFIGALLEGLGRSFYSGNNDALLHDSLVESGSESEYHRYFGRLQSFDQIGLAVVAVVGSLMASVSFRLVMWTSVIPRIILVILALQMVEPKIHLEKSTNIFSHLRESFMLFKQNEKLQLLTIIDAVRFALGEGAFVFRSAFVATLWPLWAVGFSSMISFIGGAVGFSLSGVIIDSLGYKTVLISEIIGNRIINFIALLFPSVASPALVGLTSVGYGPSTVAINTLFQKEFTQRERATLGSLSSLFGSMTFGVVAVGLGFLGDRVGPVNTLITVNILLLSLLFLYQRLFSRKRPV